MLRSRFFWKIFLAFFSIILVFTLAITYLMAVRTEEIVERARASAATI